MKKIYLAGGCFWGVQHFLSLIDGVSKTTVGYANSDVFSPSYEQVKAHETTASECVEVVYDEEKITLKEILNLFFKIIDPTQVDGQAHDIGHQYRTGIYFIDESEKELIERELKCLAEQYIDEVVTEILPLENFYNAEEYHQDYLLKNPNGYCHVSKDLFEIAKNYKRGN